MGLFGVPILIGWALEVSNPGVNAETLAQGAVYDYTVPELIFAGFGVLAVILSFVLKIVDKKRAYGLDIPNIKK
jgi:hypothetical protein